MWKELAAQGWLGIHLPERWGGQGYGLFELAVVLEQTGRSLLPGPLLTTAVVSALVAEAGTEAQGGELLPGLADGSTTAALAVGDSLLEVVERGADAGMVVTGHLRPVLGTSTASIVLIPVRDGDGSVVWCLVDIGTSADAAQVVPLESLDPTATRRHADSRSCHRPRDAPGAGALHRAGAPGRRRLERGRAGRRRPVVPRDGFRLRQGAPSVRAPHRAVPSGQAPAGRHAGPRRADDRSGVGRRPGRGGGTLGGGRAGAVRCRRDRLRRLRRLRQGLHPAPRRHRLHLGARRTPAPQAGPGRSPVAGGHRPLPDRGDRPQSGWHPPFAHR